VEGIQQSCFISMLSNNISHAKRAARELLITLKDVQLFTVSHYVGGTHTLLALRCGFFSGGREMTSQNG